MNNVYMHLIEEIDSNDDLEQLNLFDSQLRDAELLSQFWKSRQIFLNSTDKLIRKKALVKCHLVERIYGASIPITKNVNRFVAPHGLSGIHISAYCKLGKGCTIFQHVTIGSNTLPDSNSKGFPIIGENVYFGAGASVIGNVKIGDNVRIGANCIVTEDVPDNSVVVLSKPKIIKKPTTLDNRFIRACDFVKNMNITEKQ